MGVAVPIFAAVLGAGYTYAFHSAPGGDDAMDMLPMIGVAGLLAGMLVGFLIVPWFRYPHFLQAMTVGVVSAVVSHLPFSLIFALIDTFMGGTAPTVDGVMRLFHYTLTQGAEIVFLPLVASGAIAGTASYILSRRHISTHE